MNHFLEVALLTFGFLFLPLMIGELVRTPLGRLLVFRDGSEFVYFVRLDNFMRILVDVSFCETFMGVDLWTDAGVKACNFNMLFST